VQLLLDRSKEAVQVDVQEAEAIGLKRGIHHSARSILFAVYSRALRLA
jgi:hypothetical protein